MLGHHHTDEAKAKMSQAKIGITFTDEHCAKLSAAKIGKPGNNLGNKHTSFSIEKIKVSKRATELRKIVARCSGYLNLPIELGEVLPNHLLWIKNLPKDSFYNPPYQNLKQRPHVKSK